MSIRPVRAHRPLPTPRLYAASLLAAACCLSCVAFAPTASDAAALSTVSPAKATSGNLSPTSTLTTGSYGQVKGDSIITIKPTHGTKKNGNFLFLGWWWLFILTLAAVGGFILLLYRQSDED